MATLRVQYIASQRNLRFEAINRAPTLKVNQPAVDALVNRVGPVGKPVAEPPPKTE